MTVYLSKKFRTSSFLLMVLIVFLHSYNLVINYQHGPIVLDGEYLNYLLQKFVSDGICRIAVPIFFIISGYLFFINISNFDIKTYKVKVLRRTHTVLVPFLLWSSLVAFAILLLQTLPFSDFYFYKYILKDFTLLQWLNILFFHPINYQLWFLQVLFALVLLSPVIFFLMKRLKWLSLVALTISWFAVNYIPHQIPFFDGLIFFSLGAYFATFKVKIDFTVKKKYLAALYVIWFMLIAVKIYFELSSNMAAVRYLEKLFIIVGTVCFWFSIDHVIHPLNQINKKYSIYCYSFFIFLFHEPTLVAIKKLLLHLMGVGVLSNFITYISAPVVTIFLSIFLGKFLKWNWPGLYNLLTGYR